MLVVVLGSVAVPPRPEQQPLLHALLQGETERGHRFSAPAPSPLCVGDVPSCVLSCSGRASNGISATRGAAQASLPALLRGALARTQKKPMGSL